MSRTAISGASPEALPHVVEANRQACALQLGLADTDLPLTWVSELACCGPEEEGRSVADHCSDFTVHLDRHRQAVVVTLLGTR